MKYCVKLYKIINIMNTKLQSKKSYNIKSDIKEKKKENGKECYFLIFYIINYNIAIFIY